MLYRLLSQFLFVATKSDKMILGRWGYHWEKYKEIQKYYD